MSYAIRYDAGTTKKYPLKRKKYTKHRKGLLIVGFLLAIVLLSACITPVRRFLLPGDPVVTESAIIKMADELQAGEGLQEAFSTFCQEVIRGSSVN